MKIKTGTFHPRPGTFPEPDAQMGLIRGFVRTETDIPVETKKGFVDPWIGLDPRGDLFQPGAHGQYKIPGWGQDLLFIHRLVLIKPHLGVVLGEFTEKGDGLLGKTVKSDG